MERGSAQTRVPRFLGFAILACLIVSFFQPGKAQDITYSYDDWRRLELVNYGNGKGIRYFYDRAGNLLRLRVKAVPDAPTVTSISRQSGASGTMIVITGANLLNAAVSFNGEVGTIISNTDTRIVVLVPPGATTGPVRVSTPGGSLAGAFFFNVTVPTTQLSLALNSGGGSTATTIGPANVQQSGYATIAVTSGEAPYGTAVFSFTQNGTVVSEVGVPASPPTKTARFFIDFRREVPASSGTIDVLTGFAAVNRGSGTANISLRLRAGDGTTLSTGTITLAQNVHVAKFIDQLTPEFLLPSNFSTIGFASLEFTSDQPLSILALRLTTNQRRELLLTSTPIANLGNPLLTGPLYFPQVADGGGFQTSFIFLNTSNSEERGTIQFFSSDGSPLSVGLTSGGSPAAQFAYTIPLAGFIRLVTNGAPVSVKTGWALLTPDEGTATPAGAGIFSFTEDSNLITESGVPSATLTTQARIYIDKSSGHDTGLAIANPGTSPIRITATAFGLDGITPAGGGPGVLDLGGDSHDARFVGQLIPGGLPDGFTGVLNIQAASPFAALTLRSLINERGDFLLTTFPIADATRSAPTPLIFPQIADGGGFQTQFIFLSTSGSRATLTIHLLDDNGLPLAIGQSQSSTAGDGARQKH